MPIIDCHVHLHPPGSTTAPWISHPDYREVMAWLAAEGIQRLVAFPTFANAPNNEGMARLAEAGGGTVIPFAWVNPHLGETALSEARRLLHARRLRGIKFHPLLHAFFPNRPLLDPFMKMAADEGVPVLFHSGHSMQSLPWQIAEVAESWPAVTVIMDHMGLQLGWVDDAIRLAEKIPNLVLGTTAMPFHLKIREAVDRVGSGRVVWGSDAPSIHPRVELLRVKVAGLTAQQEADVLGNSILRLLGESDSTG
ncbi:MAG: amidohydrolase family protein [Chloroflexi bacterium]|nr:amidohydrolase family protein [Chloroflexota bacterium]MCL5108821.1 amidohydrolase family protein [Chloroflexota bacterium]